VADCGCAFEIGLTIDTLYSCSHRRCLAVPMISYGILPRSTMSPRVNLLYKVCVCLWRCVCVCVCGGGGGVVVRERESKYGKGVEKKRPGCHRLKCTGRK
jgi:hypothetical protein